MDAVAVAKMRAARRRCSPLRRLTLALRCLEAVAGVLLLSWSSSRLSDAARLSGNLACRLVAFLLSSRFVFLLGNAIVLLLVVKSSRQCSAGASSEGDIYDQFLDCRGRIQPCTFPLDEPSQQCKAVVKVTGAEKEAATADEEEVEADEVEAEEFRQTIEAFIAKQLKFRRQESMSEVCSVGKPEPPNIVACF